MFKLCLANFAFVFRQKLSPISGKVRANPFSFDKKILLPLLLFWSELIYVYIIIEKLYFLII
jgi:hypothetical protein